MLRQRFLAAWYWYPLFLLTLIFLDPILRYVLEGRPWPDILALVLAGLGQFICVTCMVTAQSRWDLDPDASYRFRTLGLQASAALVIGTVAQQAWGSPVGGLPVIISLVAVVTTRDAAEAIMLWIRARETQVETQTDTASTLPASNTGQRRTG